MWSDSGIRVLAGSLASISAAGRLYVQCKPCTGLSYTLVQIALQVSELTELRRAQRHQPEVSKPHSSQHNTDDCEVARVKVRQCTLFVVFMLTCKQSIH